MTDALSQAGGLALMVGVVSKKSSTYLVDTISRITPSLSSEDSCPITKNTRRPQRPARSRTSLRIDLCLQTGSTTLLVDLTPRGLEIVSPRVGDRVAIEGEQNLLKSKYSNSIAMVRHLRSVMAREASTSMRQPILR
jgi:hypothetical protein